MLQNLKRNRIISRNAGFKCNLFMDFRHEILKTSKRSLMYYDSLANRIQTDQHFTYQRDESVPIMLNEAIKTMHLSPSVPMAMFINLDRFKRRGIELNRAFSNAGMDRVTHALAVKALPLPRLLKEGYLMGMGAECASKGETDVSLKAGMPPSRIVYDSPCKTMDELINILSKGIYLNVDNFQELERVRTILEDLFPSSGVRCPKPNVGIRVNPVVGKGEIEATSTATMHSKFGVNIDEYRDELMFAYQKFPWLNSVHCHVGSQGCSVDMITDGVKKTVDFAEEVNQINDGSEKLKIEQIDIGGGLPVNYESDTEWPTFDHYVQKLKEKTPILFEKPNKYHIYTEFGRSLVQKCGWIASRVEYTKHTGEKNIAIIHAGAHLLLRTAYQPEIWKHHITVHNADGEPKEGPTVKYDIAGPLCFSGDLVAKDVDLPPIEPGDYVVIHDAGGYSYCMYSRYNSRPAPPIYGYESQSDDITPNIQILKQGETSLDIMAFWET